MLGKIYVACKNIFQNWHEPNEDVVVSNSLVRMIKRKYQNLASIKYSLSIWIQEAPWAQYKEERNSFLREDLLLPK